MRCKAYVLNNLTWAAYGDHAGTRVNAPEGADPPDVPGGRKRDLMMKPDDCPLRYDGVSHFECPKKHKMKDGVCDGEIKPSNQCQVFCEIRRTGFFGMEQRLEGEAGQRSPSGVKVTLGAGHEVAISNGFSINGDGVWKDAIGLGVSYECRQPTVCDVVTRANLNGREHIGRQKHHHRTDGRRHGAPWQVLPMGILPQVRGKLRYHLTEEVQHGGPLHRRSSRMPPDT